MEVRPGRMAGRADQADLGAGRQRDAVDDAGLEEGEVAIGPHRAVVRADRHADAAARVGGVPGVDHDRVRDRIDGRARRRRDVGGRVVVVRVRDRDELRAAADREDVVARGYEAAPIRVPTPGAKDGAWALLRRRRERSPAPARAPTERQRLPSRAASTRTSKSTAPALGSQTVREQCRCVRPGRAAFARPPLSCCSAPVRLKLLVGADDCLASLVELRLQLLQVDRLRDPALAVDLARSSTSRTYQSAWL